MSSFLVDGLDLDMLVTSFIEPINKCALRDRTSPVMFYIFTYPVASKAKIPAITAKMARWIWETNDILFMKME